MKYFLVRACSVLVFPVVAVACSRPETGTAQGSRPVSSNDAAAGSSAFLPSIPSMTNSASAASSAPPVEAAPRGTIGLVIQHVEADCGVGVGASGTGHFSVGTDVLLETRVDDDKTRKPTKDYVFCPKVLADGGAAKVRLDIWQNCKAYVSCKVLSADATADRTEIQCGKDNVVLEVVGGRTVLRGPFGEREIAPYRMNIAPVRRDNRTALVDC